MMKWVFPGADEPIGWYKRVCVKEINEESIMTEHLFKTCPMCTKTWVTRDDFLSDPELAFNGYQANFDIMDQGHFYFTHERVECGSTMIIEAQRFLSLYSGERYTENRHLQKDCPGLCLDKKNVKRCEVMCEHAFGREVSQIIADRQRIIVTAG